MRSSRIGAILERCVGPDVLDIGCSGGLQETEPEVWSESWLHGHLRSRFPELWGVDLSERRLGIMRANGHTNLVAMDAQHLELGRLFDTIVAGEIIEHLENPGLFLRCARNHLKPDGRIVLTTPYVFGVSYLAYAYLKYPKTCSNPEHTMWFCPATIRQLADRCGLTVLECKLVADFHAPEGSPRRPYFAMLRLLRLLRRLIPARVRSTNMVVVLAAAPEP
jgi:SAM-dependent methyltransferase